MRGLFITFESIDGVGKTTQARLLADTMRHRGHEVFLTKEPGDHTMGSNIGSGVRHLLFTDPTTKMMRPGVADMLFLADHIQTAGDVVEQLNSGCIVIADRYADSQFAYAASSAKQCPEWALQLFTDHYGVIPDLTILMVARGAADPVTHEEDIGWALERARQGVEGDKQQGKRWDSVEDQRQVQRAYIKGLKAKSRCEVIDVWQHMTPDDIALRIALLVSVRLMRQSATPLRSLTTELSL